MIFFDLHINNKDIIRRAWSPGPHGDRKISVLTWTIS